MQRRTLSFGRAPSKRSLVPKQVAALHDSLGAMLRPRGSRCGIGRSSSAAGTTIESMHHGQRDAALGRDRLQERQTRFDRNILISCSVGRREAAGGMNIVAWTSPEQGVTCGIEDGPAHSGEGFGLSRQAL